MRVKMTIAYNGAGYFGSQVQKETDQTVNGQIEKALSLLQIETKVIASGRTDRGVHASRQVLHFDLPPFWNDLNKLKESLKRILPANIAIRRMEQVDEDFHARYSARKRAYRYILSTQTPNPFLADLVTYVDTIDETKIKEAITLFEGVHDFEYFKKSGSDTINFVREIYKTRVYRHNGCTVLYFEANGFLRSQIRLMVGFLLEISAGRYMKEDLQAQLALEKQFKLKPAPHQGLYLCNIRY
ncbi:MAG: tRNA pseudouridine(38-40) synthase TruA [Helicobacteraceae bacterium]|jgi:tRNA pseudouridine38-40 synthase|nr:tRNA pseudouridine(38-40) synthase TruA [Helicobacteraceae bacterium]